MLDFNYEREEDDGLSSANIAEMARAFNRACELYKESMAGDRYESMKASDFWVLFVVDEGERNVCDQKWIEVTLFETYKVRSLRMTLSQVEQRVTRNEATGAISVDGKLEVALVYYRTGYQVE